MTEPLVRPCFGEFFCVALINYADDGSLKVSLKRATVQWWTSSHTWCVLLKTSTTTRHSAGGSVRVTNPPKKQIFQMIEIVPYWVTLSRVRVPIALFLHFRYCQIANRCKNSSTTNHLTLDDSLQPIAVQNHSRLSRQQAGGGAGGWWRCAGGRWQALQQIKTQGLLLMQSHHCGSGWLNRRRHKEKSFTSK